MDVFLARFPMNLKVNFNPYAWGIRLINEKPSYLDELEWKEYKRTGVMPRNGVGRPR